MATRKIVRIDESKCDGCGQCVPACAEGALRIIDGKARLVSDVYCDGLGACLGHCPQDAIEIIEREADEFDEQAVEERLEQHSAPKPGPTAAAPSGGCPGMQAQSFSLPVAGPSSPPAGPMPRGLATFDADADGNGASGLSHWPIQLKLIPPNAPFLQDADLVLTADCAPAAVPGFHERLLRGRPMALACPKLDDAPAHVAKLAAVLAGSTVRKLTILRMEVPCCGGLESIAQSARDAAGRDVPIEVVTISTRGRVKGAE